MQASDFRQQFVIQILFQGQNAAKHLSNMFCKKTVNGCFFLKCFFKIPIEGVLFEYFNGFR